MVRFDEYFNMRKLRSRNINTDAASMDFITDARNFAKTLFVFVVASTGSIR